MYDHPEGFPTVGKRYYPAPAQGVAVIEINIFSTDPNGDTTDKPSVESIRVKVFTSLSALFFTTHPFFRKKGWLGRIGTRA